MWAITDTLGSGRVKPFMSPGHLVRVRSQGGLLRGGAV